MSVFFDTNVLVYCTDTTAPKKQAIARALVSTASASGDAMISTQVLIELFNVYTRKQQMPPAHANALVTAYCVLPCVLKLAAGGALYFLIIQPSSQPSKATA